METLRGQDATPFNKRGNGTVRNGDIEIAQPVRIPRHFVESGFANDPRTGE